MAAGDATKAPSKGSTEHKRGVGTYIAYGKDGSTIIWKSEKDAFAIGVDAIPPGLSMTMGASRIVDGSGEDIFMWDPNHLIHEPKVVAKG